MCYTIVVASIILLFSVLLVLGGLAFGTLFMLMDLTRLALGTFQNYKGDRNGFAGRNFVRNGILLIVLWSIVGSVFAFWWLLPGNN